MRYEFRKNTEQDWDSGREVWLTDPDSPIDERHWQFFVLHGRMLIRTWNDAKTVCTEAVIDRLGHEMCKTLR